MRDPFARVRRGLQLDGPLMIAVGGILLNRGLTGSSLNVLFSVLGGVIALLGLVRMVTCAVVLRNERRRVRVLREGDPATATITAVRDLHEEHAGYPIYGLELTIKRPDGTVTMTERKGAVPVQYAGSLNAGDELPIRLGEDGSTFAVDWDQL